MIAIVYWDKPTYPWLRFNFSALKLHLNKLDPVLPIINFTLQINRWKASIFRLHAIQIEKVEETLRLLNGNTCPLFCVVWQAVCLRRSWHYKAKVEKCFKLVTSSNTHASFQSVRKERKNTEQRPNTQLNSHWRARNVAPQVVACGPSIFLLRATFSSFYVKHGCKFNRNWSFKKRIKKRFEKPNFLWVTQLWRRHCFCLCLAVHLALWLVRVQLATLVASFKTSQPLFFLALPPIN